MGWQNSTKKEGRSKEVKHTFVAGAIEPRTQKRRAQVQKTNLGRSRGEQGIGGIDGANREMHSAKPAEYSVGVPRGLQEG
jgi:hypothetical protein